MKLTNELLITEVGDDFVAVPVGGDDSFRGIVRLNETGAFIVNGLMDGLDREQIAARMVSEYEGLTQETAEDAVDSVLNKLKAEGLIEE